VSGEDEGCGEGGAVRILKTHDNNFVPNFHVLTSNGSYVFISSPNNPCYLREGEYISECYIPANFLNDDTFCVGLAVTSYFRNGSFIVNFFKQNALSFNIKDDLTSRSGYVGRIPGVVRPKTEVFYQMSEFYHPECARGVRWDDPAFGIEWPISDKIISVKDRSYAYC